MQIGKLTIGRKGPNLSTAKRKAGKKMHTNSFGQGCSSVIVCTQYVQGPEEGGRKGKGSGEEGREERREGRKEIMKPKCPHK
jgi:3-hydroxy-3-methylglutaryl CoA synthase